MTKKLEDVFAKVADEAADQVKVEAERRRRNEEEHRERRAAAHAETARAAASFVTKAGGHAVHHARFGVQTLASAIIPAGIGLSAGVMLAALLDHIQKNRKG